MLAERCLRSFIRKYSRIRVTMNLFTYADSNLDTNKKVHILKMKHNTSSIFNFVVPLSLFPCVPVSLCPCFPPLSLCPSVPLSIFPLAPLSFCPLQHMTSSIINCVVPLSFCPCVPVSLLCPCVPLSIFPLGRLPFFFPFVPFFLLSFCPSVLFFLFFLLSFNPFRPLFLCFFVSLSLCPFVSL